MQTVPGQSDGEYKKEQLAVIRQPRARPALLWLRRADGKESIMVHAIEATVRVLKMIANTDIVGGVWSSIEEKIVIMASRTPAARVILISPTEEISGLAAEDRVPPGW